MLDHLPVQVSEDHWAVHRFCYQVLFVLHFFISSFFLINLFVWEPYKLFEGVNVGDEIGGAVDVSGLRAGDTNHADGPKRNSSLGESGGANGAGGIPIKPFGLSGSGGLGYAVGRRNGSRNLHDGGGKMEVLMEVLMVVL